MKQVKIGVGFGLWRLGMPPAETSARVAEHAEDWGLDSFWLSDHLLAPSPELDVVATLSLLASRTSRMKLGPSVLLLNLRHPLMVAKSFASLDYLSNGRMVMAVGTGANLNDYAACGIPVEGRGKRLDEGIEVLRTVWRDRVASYHGRFFNFDNVTIEPRPVARTNNDFGTMDIWVGGPLRRGAETCGAPGRRLLRVVPDPRRVRREHGEDSRLCGRLWSRQRTHRIGTDPALPHLVVA
jgi:alkanesulfonate monooxygenase SsuD/methylene tetrahydromethanopterin reductase-like flavin-dependent oxidoreductase (luciferase family)